MNFTGPIAALHDNAAHVAVRLRLLAHRDRLIMLCRMTDGEVSVGELVTLTGLSQASVSQHLAVLRDAGAVRVRAEAQSRFYRLVDAQVAGIIAALCDYSGRIAGEPG